MNATRIDQIDPLTGEVTAENVRTYEPAVLPLAAVGINPPLPVRALSAKGGLKKGAIYYAMAVHMSGRLSLLKAGLHPMDNFVEMLEFPQPGNVSQQLEPANDNKPKK